MSALIWEGFKNEILRRVNDVTILDQKDNNKICKFLNDEPKVYQFERSQV